LVVSYQPPQQPYQPPAVQPVVAIGDWRPVSGWATASLVLGLISLCGGFFLVIPPILAIVFGHLGVRQTNRGQRGSGMAATGLVIGYLFLLLDLLFLVSKIAGKAAGA
jgi:hypothetical protein